ncbi:hypothetical protein A3K34_02510 [candidate division WWE3 bacterium RIFOXYC1_FULL_40_10]|uniref:Uncharacterized protein n=1 Tax=candidate division WWE3 bacterium RIFOXYA2_FULL_46_9 TaxID=1802636 RepID=A0A1F4W2R6_UNCKA|nr:MAG: hypothetical protein A3K58_02510 [candidate division WWE3 bacterium RIFOXYB1_FULL_40_22]OGC61723.1 MAG: hypothetical protein A3K37_02510 [candidate division WWE3 bacterium RIFOXYA1_FULL_40_11]OGC63707.1 MAG: hypothetical protein A2264_05000 [candidate division WWE3 bacterium RIFOXYA2_FULL_46_9]OGC64896.1 MAG: hypothetical protein A2326_01335 [candidate division WWE3 bacterium RIFOXYB2_FULL_41_6]OGC66106.1 MAG: hypothetical protein A3K34_02510 [candidate division WWE3 bacterium RIFOXYC1_
MKTKFWIVLVVVAFALSFATIPEKVKASELNLPSISVNFQGQPQWEELSISNTGLIEFLFVPTSTYPTPDYLDNGRVWYKTPAGDFRIDENLWSPSEEVEGAYVWHQATTSSVQSFWIDTYPGILIDWNGYGPWEEALIHYTYSGIELTEGSTAINFTVYPPVYLPGYGVQNPIWDWYTEAFPMWAADQFGPIIMDIQTSCDGFGDNHEGEFEWETDMQSGLWFGNGVPRLFVLDPFTEVLWTLMRPDGTILAQGISQGPSCGTNLMWLPLIQQ